MLLFLGCLALTTLAIPHFVNTEAMNLQGLIQRKDLCIGSCHSKVKDKSSHCAICQKMWRHKSAEVWLVPRKLRLTARDSFLKVSRICSEGPEGKEATAPMCTSPE